MEEKLVTLAIHSYDRAIILKSLLESEGIEAYIHNVNILIPQSSEGVRVRIKESDLSKALSAIESSTFKGDTVNVAEPLLLIPVDFSPYSLRACKLGFYMAKELGAKVVIAHIYYIPFIPISLSVNDMIPVFARAEIDLDNKKALRYAEKGMDVLVKEIKVLQESGELPQVDYSTLIREGTPEEGIVQLGKELNPTLIVMGTRGAAAREDTLLGSVTAEVIEQSKQKILAVSKDAPLKMLKNINNIAYATNFDDRALLAFDDLVRLMGERRITYTIVHFDDKKSNPKDEKRLEIMTKYLAIKYPAVPINYRLVATNNLLADLNDFLEKESIDLLSITTHKRNPFSKLLYSSFASKMLFCSKIPILVVRA